jgi:very-short-patch-repair endonuclease
LWTPVELAEAASRLAARGRTGCGQLARLLGLRVGEPRVESMLERRVGRALALFRPFITQFQVVLEGEVLLLDVAWPHWLVAVEADGWAVRERSFGKFSRDRHRDNLLAAHGWRVAHVTADMDDDAIRGDVARLLPADAWRQARTTWESGSSGQGSDHPADSHRRPGATGA